MSSDRTGGLSMFAGIDVGTNCGPTTQTGGSFANLRAGSCDSRNSAGVKCDLADWIPRVRYFRGVGVIGSI